MAKRRRASEDDSEEDASYEPAVKARRRRVALPLSKNSKRVGRLTGDQAEDGESFGTAEHYHMHCCALHQISNSNALRVPLLKWYDGVHHLRGMPWRKPFDPSLDANGRGQRAYEVWISEIMLQQTQVATVIPYYSKWMEKFPTIQHLAESDIETVNALWKGLGYYSRAARLLQGAKKAVEELGGRLPDNAQDMESKIPGIGKYSAGAICSIAYNQCVPVLDGNVHRLLSRVLALHAPPKAKATLDILWAGASAMVEECDRPGDVNQALIELGSTICKVRDPDCSSCPLVASCKAYQRQHDAAQDNEEIPSVSEGVTITSHDVPDIEDLCTLCEPLLEECLVTAYPMKAERKRAREELDIVNVVEWRHQDTQDRWFLLVRRPEGGLLAGLHEFPTASNQPGTLTASATQELSHKLLSALLDTTLLPYVRAARQHGGRAVQDVPSQLHDREPDESTSPLYIASVKQAGDVIHVFSHIKKTYRVQWVLLQGGGNEPPPLVRLQAAIGGATSQKQRTQSSRTQKTKMKTTVPASDVEKAIPLPQEARWLPMEDVPNANVGTGVLKVWKRVCSLWDDDVK